MFAQNKQASSFEDVHGEAETVQLTIPALCETTIPAVTGYIHQVRPQSRMGAERRSMNTQQLSIFDERETRTREKRAEIMLQKLRRLHEELNTLYGSAPEERPRIENPRTAAELFQPFLAHLDHEELWIGLLDTRHRITSMVKVYQGTLDQTPVRIADLFRPAIVNGSAAIIIAHNHPSGDPSPSPEDINITRGIIEIGKLLGIEVLDHLIVGHGHDWFVSLKQRLSPLQDW